jgi:hypothetical protein
MERKIWVITSDIPVPTNHGSRVDQWSRFKLLKKYGVRTALTSWYRSAAPPSSENRLELDSIFDETHLYSISQDTLSMLHRLATLYKWSPHVSTRILSSREFDALCAAVVRFDPQAIWLDGLFGGEMAYRLAATLSLPVLYRSHNVEHYYMKSQAKAAKSVRDRLAWTIAALHLPSFEFDIQKKSQWIFDISNDDLLYWRSRGIAHNSWLPTPFAATKPTPAIGFAARHWDIAYLGNLNTPNNIRGIEWFVRWVLPILQKRRPRVTIQIAGSQPSKELRMILADADNITLTENPLTTDEILGNARVLINPVLTGSGVNVKSLEMLGYDSHIVTTDVGVRGLPQLLRSEFRIASEPETFAEYCLEALTGYEVTDSRISARALFGPHTMHEVIAAIDRVGQQQLRKIAGATEEA